jgi:cytoskeletal protein RodZ
VITFESLNWKDVALMDEEKDGKKLAFWLVLFFLIVILLGGFVGKRLVQIVRASMDQDTIEVTQSIDDKDDDAKVPESADNSGQVAPLESAGGYSFPTPTSYQPPIPTATVQPTESPTNTLTALPTSTSTKNPASTATASPTIVASATPSSTPPLLFGEGSETPSITLPIVTGTTPPEIVRTEIPPTQPSFTLTPAPSKPPTVGPDGNPGSFISAGIFFGLIGLLCFGLYFRNSHQIKR